MSLQQHAVLSPQTTTGPSLSSSNRRTGARSDSFLLGAMEACLSVQPQEGSRIQSRDGSGGVGRGTSASRARPSWFRRALGGLLRWKQPAAVEAPAPARARERSPTESERPRWSSSLKKAVGSALARVACICEPVCSGAHDDDVVEDPRKRRRRRRRRRGIRFGARSPPGESEDYWTYAFRGRSSFIDDVLMRRYVLQEEAMRRRMEMRVAAGYGLCWFPPGPSRLSQMSLADDDDSDDEAGENSSTSPQCSEALSF